MKYSDKKLRGKGALTRRPKRAYAACDLGDCGIDQAVPHLDGSLPKRMQLPLPQKEILPMTPYEV